MTLPESGSMLDILDAELATLMEAAREAHAAAMLARVAGDPDGDERLMARAVRLVAEGEVVEGRIDAEIDRRLSALGHPSQWSQAKIRTFLTEE